jgi:protein-S-isoprenylcysteine O-methyltransferase Ste14
MSKAFIRNFIYGFFMALLLLLKFSGYFFFSLIIAVIFFFVKFKETLTPFILKTESDIKRIYFGGVKND